jgi:hypothetical protein
MAAAHSIPIKLREGKRLADLFSIGNDLQFVLDSISLLQTLQATKIDPFTKHIMIDCVTTSIFVRYGRCFMDGARTDAQVELRRTLTPEDEKVHEVAMAIRSRHYAHSINNLEAPHITASLSVGTPKKQVTSVAPASHVVLPTDPTLLHNLSVLASKLHDWLIAEQKAESRRLLRIVRERFSLDELYSMIGATSRRKQRFSDMAKTRKIS